MYLVLVYVTCMIRSLISDNMQYACVIPNGPTKIIFAVVQKNYRFVRNRFLKGSRPICQVQKLRQGW